MENTFRNSECPENLKVRYGTSVLQKRALTWWNGEKNTRGADAAYALTWDEVKELMTREFCPRNEIKKLEIEFWDLKQDSGENQAYNNRFHELSLLAPHLVTPLARKIEKYIEGLPLQIQDTVLGRNPTTLEDAIRLAATLTDNHVKAGTLTRKGAKKPEKAPTEPTATQTTEAKSEPYFKHDKKRKANHQNYAVTTPNPPAIPINQVPFTTQPYKKPYTGAHPLCNTCRYHHPIHIPCRQCTNCGRLGHFFTNCRLPVRPQANQPNVPLIAAQPAVNGRACYHCGDPTHFRNACPKLMNIIQVPVNQGDLVARGRVYNINANQAQADNEENNG